jgi:tRNA(Ile)-lysidine synthase
VAREPVGSEPAALPAGRTRDELVAEVRTRLAHLAHGARVLVACSGGPDSTALAFLSGEARPDLESVLVHVRHGLRDDEHDLAVIERHASWLGCGCVVRSVEVRPDGHGVEAAARDARYAALRAVAKARRAVGILVGHTADDQAETVLLRLARGTGLDGLRAMAPVVDDLTRPLLRIRRDDVRRFVSLEGLPTVEDPSNADPAVRRAVVRHSVLPALGEVAPDPVGALTRLAELARDDADALDAAALPLRRAVRTTGPVRSVPLDALADVHPGLARRVIRSLLTELTGRPPTAAVVARVLAAGPGSAASLPGGIELTVTGGWLALSPHVLPSAQERRIEVPASTPWSPAGVAIRASSFDGEPGPDPATPGQLGFRLGGAPPRRPRVAARIVPPGGVADRLWMPLPAVTSPLQVRARRAGDRVRTAGGTRSVADVLSDAGMPRPVRELWPVVTCGASVAWVPGFAADDELLRAGRAAPAALLVLVPASGGGGATTGR